MPAGWEINITVDPLSLRALLEELAVWTEAVRKKESVGQKFFLTASVRITRQEYTLKLTYIFRAKCISLMQLAMFVQRADHGRRHIELREGPWLSFEDEMMNALAEVGFDVEAVNSRLWKLRFIFR